MTKYGWTAAEALWCLLRFRGHEVSVAYLRESLGTDASVEDLIHPLAKLGIQARPTHIREGDLAFLSLPTLAQAKDDSWLVVKSKTRAGFLVLEADGPTAIGEAKLQSKLSGQALDLSPGLPPGTSLWSRLRTLMGGFSPVLFLIVAATVAIQLLGLVTPALTRVILNRAIPDGAVSLLTLLTAGVVLMAVFHAWIDYVRGRALLYFTQRMDISAERGFLEHILSLPYNQLRKRGLGEWLQAFSGFAVAREVLTEKSLGVLLDGVLALVLLAAMVFMLPGPSVLVGAVTLVMAGATMLVGRVEVKLEERQVEVQVKEQGYLSELLNGIATIKAASEEVRSLLRWKILFRKGLALSLQRGRISLWTNTGLALLGKGLDATLLIWGGLAVVEGSLGLGTFLAFLQVASAFMAAVLGLAGTCVNILVLGPQLAKASGILELPREPDVPRQRPSPIPEPLVMDDVGFRYRPEGPWILQGYGLDVKAGDSLQLSGPSGWGKSTLLRLLAGLEVPDKGEIRIGGDPPGQARHKLLYLPQFVQLYGGSILENLKVLSGGASLEAIQRAAALTGLEAFVATLPMGFKTILPPGGRTLSGGQRQWVALTAALASGRGVLLLDEPLASLDPVVAARLAAALDAGPWTLVSAGHSGGLSSPK